MLWGEMFHPTQVGETISPTAICIASQHIIFNKCDTMEIHLPSVLGVPQLVESRAHLGCCCFLYLVICSTNLEMLK